MITISHDRLPLGQHFAECIDYNTKTLFPLYTVFMNKVRRNTGGSKLTYVSKPVTTAQSREAYTKRTTSPTLTT